MTRFLDKWPPDPSAWTPIDWATAGTLVTTAVAVVAAVFAWIQVRHARQLREEQAKPYVIVGFEPSPAYGNAINLFVQNIGNTVASDVRITFDQRLERAALSSDLNQSPLLTEGIRSMPPNMRLETLFDLSHERYEKDLLMVYMATVSYRGLTKKREEHVYTLDMGIYYGLEGFQLKGSHQTAKALEEIAKTLKKWTGTHGRLKVWTRDEDYDTWSDRWQHERGGHSPSLGIPYPASRRSPSPYDSLNESLPRRAYWAAKAPIARRMWQWRERREDRKLEKAGRPDLVLARRASRGE